MSAHHWTVTYTLTTLVGVSNNMRKRSYLQGFYEGAAYKISEARRDVIEQAGTGAEVALIDRKQQVLDWVAEQSFKIRKSSQANYDVSARNDGVAQGRKADIGQHRFARAKEVGV